ncbi:MAG: Flp pilus assembly complex ATPase component TadA [Candidatus Omnitrophica bacterium]|nr:Flp pilus assembly complex ATPase component TadA [Candidatus Omnitrophota bacterium]MCG2703193.1 Flp pilus assembly complex ATPase component TadA [Candidatus Omnitrophota bacterium]
MQENTTDIPIDNLHTENPEPAPEERIAESRAKRLPSDFIGKTGEGTCRIQPPEKITVESCLDKILVFARNKNATDVHIAVGSRIFFRISGILKAQTEGTVSEEQLQKTIRSVLDAEKLINWSQGMVLVTGPIGCGKTTTLSVLCEIINQTRREHIISIEQPIEFVFISELRDAAMIQLAATAAETGHLVLGTMNTNDAAQTILRLVNSFPSSDRSLVQNMISESLRGIICQQLIPRKDGKGVVAAFEVLLVNTAVSNLIRKGSIDQLVRIISTGSAEGRISMDNYLLNLVSKGKISSETAYLKAFDKALFKK